MVMEEYLEHHGVKGMKWGVRKYRQYPGSYTKSGVKRFDISMSKYDDAVSKKK